MDEPSSGPLRLMKRAIRLHRQENFGAALLELDLLIAENPDWWVPFALRARLCETRSRYATAAQERKLGHSAIADFATALRHFDSISVRHQREFLKRIETVAAEFAHKSPANPARRARVSCERSNAGRF